MIRGVLVENNVVGIYETNSKGAWVQTTREN